MTAISILLTLSALSGFVIGKSHFSWPALIVMGGVLAPLTAVVLQWQGFAPLPGIFTIVACLVVNQLAYVLATRPNNDLTSGSAENLPEQRTNGVSHDDRNDDVCHNDKGEQNSQFHLA